MKRLIGEFLFLWLAFTVNAIASVTRTIDADAIISSNHSKTWNFPTTADTFCGIAATQTLTNKTINGSNNTLSNIPVSASIVQETPSGTINGSNTSFSLANTPGSNSSVQVHLDGVLLVQGTDYTISSATISMTTAPALGQSLYVVYAKF